MAFTLVSDLFQAIDDVTTDFALDSIGDMIAYAAPIVGLGLVLSLMIQGLYTMYQPNGEPVGQLLRRFVRYAIITSIAGVGGLYQSDLASMALNLPDTISSTVLLDGNAAKPDAMGSVIDEALVDGMQVAKTAFQNVGFSGSGLAALVVAVHVVLVTAVIAGIGAAFILMAKVLLAFTIALGPIFIFALLFDNLKHLFTPWIGAVINFILTAVLISAVFSLLILFYKNAISDGVTNDNVSFISTMVSSTVLAVVAGLATIKIPGLAASLSSGITATVDMGALYHGGRVAGGAFGGAKTAGGAFTRTAAAGASAIGSGAAMTGRGAASAARGALRYARQ